MATTTKTKKAAPKKSAADKKSGEVEPALLEFFTDEVKDIYWAEKHLTKVLPKMKKAATSPELEEAIAEHLEVTLTQIERLEKVFELLGKKAQGKKCDAMEGITKEGESILEDTDEGTATRDVGIILASQKIEHYEIATYGGLAQLAETLGLSEIKELLGQTLSEEKQADEKLSSIAENDINYQASTEEE
jgi:ferritin-like metal-binding protein YciE